MTGSSVQWPGSAALLKRLEFYRDLPKSRRFAEFRGAVRGAVLTGHRDGMLAGTDGRGRPLAPLAPSTLKRRLRRGQGSVPFITRGPASRFITTFRADWQMEGGVWVLVCRWEGLDSRRGRPFAQYHLTGATKPGTRWVLPRRNVAGIRPADWEVIKRLDFQFLDDITRPTGRR
jgi:hypothetical protein